MMRKGLESVDYLHRSGFCHNSMSAESLWVGVYVCHNNRHNYTQFYTIIHHYTQLYTIIDTIIYFIYTLTTPIHMIHIGDGYESAGDL
jgi:hypothetical protein